MRTLLLSTYELGHQPLGIAGPAAELALAGHEVRGRDLSIDSLDPDDVVWAERVVVSVPMHTARRLGGDVAASIHALDQHLPIAFHGLYGTVSVDEARAQGVRAFFAGEAEDELVAWIDDPRPVVKAVADRRTPTAPLRSGLPELDRYAKLRIDGEERVSGYVEASRGCRHRCRHCPLPAVYDGRYRIVPPEVIVADAIAQVEAGARHLTFGDPDFLNGPVHALKVLRAVHRAAPDTTFDLTIKVEHLLDHREVLEELAELGVVFIVSAFEHTDDSVLAILDKGHTARDMSEAVALVDEAGMELRPTWLPFTPWTTRTHMADLVRFLADHGLWGAIDPIQLTIRLLLPDGSLLVDHPEMTPHLRGYDPASLGHVWEHPDPTVDVLARRLADTVDQAVGAGEGDREVLVRLVDIIAEAAGVSLPAVPEELVGTGLTEAWFCCAEPSTSQTISLGIGR